MKEKKTIHLSCQVCLGATFFFKWNIKCTFVVMVTHPCTADFDFKTYKIIPPPPFKKIYPYIRNNERLLSISFAQINENLYNKMVIFIYLLTIAVILDSREFSLFFYFYYILIAVNKLKIMSEEETDYVFFTIITFTTWPISSCSKQWPLQHWQIKTLCLQKQLALFFIRDKYKYGNYYYIFTST